jgi:hypothetical protein
VEYQAAIPQGERLCGEYFFTGNPEARNSKLDMKGNPAEFEAIGNRLGFVIAKEQEQQLELTWRGPRFPAYLCLGIALLLLFVTLPIVEAIRLRGFIGPAGSLWYFPVMNLILLGISFYLLLQKRSIVIDGVARKVTLSRRSMHQRILLTLDFVDIEKLKLGVDQVYSGFAVAGSSAAQSFPVPSLRLVIKGGASVLLDRGGFKRLETLGRGIGERISRPLEAETPAAR